MVKLHTLVLSIIILYAFTGTTHAVTKVANNYNELSHIVLSEVTDDSLVLFDIDGVLITSTEEFDFRSPIRINIKKQLRDKYSRAQIQEIFSDFFRKRQVRLVNPNIPQLLLALQVQHIPFTALTSWWTGEFGSLQAMEEIKIQELQQVGLSFLTNTPFVQDKIFDDFTEGKSHVPMIYQGMSLSDLASKGEILKLVLQYDKNAKFKKIIFIEDTPRHLGSVAQTCIHRSRS